MVSWGRKEMIKTRGGLGDILKEFFFERSVLRLERVLKFAEYKMEVYGIPRV